MSGSVGNPGPLSAFQPSVSGSMFSTDPRLGNFRPIALNRMPRAQSLNDLSSVVAKVRSRFSSSSLTQMETA